MFKVNKQKKFGRFEIKLDNVWIANNKQIFAVKLLANLVVASDCYIVLNMFEHVSTFNISHITWGINYNWLLLKAVNVLYVYVQFKRTNQSCSPSKISQSITIKWHTCDGNSKYNSFRESKKNLFDKAQNVLIEKNKDMKICFH